MKIKKIRLKNSYKRFSDLTIDLGDNPKRVVALVGPNGCGKSSVLDPANTSVTLHTLDNAARAVGKTLRIDLC